MGCPHCKINFQTEGVVVRKGAFKRKNGSVAKVYLCHQCGKHFSCRTKTEMWRQRKSPAEHEAIRKLFISGVSRRKSAYDVTMTRNTIDRKFYRLSYSALKEFEDFQKNFPAHTKGQFDEMRAHEHTKMKPISIPLVVSPERYILSIAVAAMAADGLLAKKSRKKYPEWKDERAKVIPKVLGKAQRCFTDEVHFTTDEAPAYPSYLKRFFPSCSHTTVKGGRGCIVGQGELKKKGFDKMFALNHTAASIRDNCSPMKRRTWTTTKKRKNLERLLILYAVHHNRIVKEKIEKKARKLLSAKN